MPDGSSDDVMTTIDALLARRQQYEGWITRIDAAGEAPDTVRARVRQDYQTRLDETITELREHAGAIAEQLADYRGQEDDLAQRAAELKEALAEAELRHAVGEYDDARWKELRTGHEDELEEAQQVLTRITGEIERLVEVQSLITTEAAAPAAEVPPLAPPPEPAEAVPEAIPPTGSAPRFEPRPTGAGGNAPPKRLILEEQDLPAAAPEDELAFLKSVTEESKPTPRESPRPPRASNPPASSGAGPAAARTLKCAECGSMNRPTEWYCEKCGAELAAL